MASLAACWGVYVFGASTAGDETEGSFCRAVVVCHPVTRSLEIVRMRPRPGVECRDIVERRWRDGVDVLRGDGGLYIEVDILSEM
jgi:hypothetical protein